jgi:hypothetical protein
MSLTNLLDSLSDSWSWPGRELDGVKIRKAPKTKNTQTKRSIAAAPTAMKMPRRISASTIPNSSTLCWCAAGTAKLVMMMTKTNRLSTLSEYSVM